MSDIETFQASPAGKAYQAVYSLQNAIDELRAAPPAVVNPYRDDIAAELLRLTDLLLKSRVEIAA